MSKSVDMTILWQSCLSIFTLVAMSILMGGPKIGRAQVQIEQVESGASGTRADLRCTASSQEARSRSSGLLLVQCEGHGQGELDAIELHREISLFPSFEK